MTSMMCISVQHKVFIAGLSSINTSDVSQFVMPSQEYIYIILIPLNPIFI